MLRAVGRIKSNQWVPLKRFFDEACERESPLFRIAVQTFRTWNSADRPAFIGQSRPQAVATRGIPEHFAFRTAAGQRLELRRKPLSNDGWPPPINNRSV